MRFPLTLAIFSAALAAPLASAFAAGTGLVTDAERVPWTRFQGRVSFSAAAPAWRAEFAPLDRTGLQLRGATVMGDLYLGHVPLGGKTQSGGFRATSGVVLGARSAIWGAPAIASPALEPRLGSLDPGREPATMPYVGIGYSSLATQRAGWSFSADLGLVSMAPGNAVRLGRVSGLQNLDDIVRDMRFAPVVQLGVNYSF